MRARLSLAKIQLSNRFMQSPLHGILPQSFSGDLEMPKRERRRTAEAKRSTAPGVGVEGGQGGGMAHRDMRWGMGLVLSIGLALSVFLADVVLPVGVVVGIPYVVVVVI